jgi:hypothetical protein
MTSLSPSLLLLTLSACSGESTPPTDKIVVISGGGHSASSAEDFHKSRFACCSDTETTAVIQAYVDTMDALAGDDVTAARTAATQLRTAAEALSQHEEAPAQARDHALKIIPLVAPWGGEDLDGMRADLRLVAAETIPLARSARLTTPGEDDLPVSVAFCPMAPGRWLQSRPELRNPYYGAKMLTCGVFEE